MTASITTEYARNAELADLAALLQDQHARKIDVVAPATALRSKGGILHVQGTDPVLTPDGVTMSSGAYLPTAVMDGHIAERLSIPVRYVRRLRETAPDLYDANVNGWLHGRSITRAAGTEVLREADARTFLFRGYRAADGSEGPGVGRALLSDRFDLSMDNLDVLTAALEGVRASGVEVEVGRCDLTDSRMYVQINAPAVAELAPELLAGYRSPFGGALGTDNPTVFAGFVLSNSEVGGGAFSLTPRLVVQVCTNGMTIAKDAMRAVHVGSKLDQGIVRWTEDTQAKNLALVTAKARDAVATFLDIEYLRTQLRGITEQAGAPVANAVRTVEHVGKRLQFTEAQTNGVLDHFIRGGQTTAGGVMQAITAYAQTVESADVAYDLEAQAIGAMALAVQAQQ